MWIIYKLWVFLIYNSRLIVVLQKELLQIDYQNKNKNKTHLLRKPEKSKKAIYKRKTIWENRFLNILNLTIVK